MTLELEIDAELAATLDAMAKQAGLDSRRYAARALQEYVRQRQGEPPHLAHDEATLLRQINEGLPEETWRRYHALVARRRAEVLTPEEHEELKALTNELVSIAGVLPPTLRIRLPPSTFARVSLEGLAIWPMG